MVERFDRAEFIAGYLAEVEEHLAGANGQLLKLEAAASKGEPQQRYVRELFRALHTIKGLSAMVGVEPIVELAHEIEELLRVRDPNARLSAEAIELLFRGVRAISSRLQSFAQRRPLEPAPPELLDALHQLHKAEPPQAPAAAALELPPELAEKLTVGDHEQLAQGLRDGLSPLCVEFAPSPDKASRGMSITSVRERLAALGEIVKVLPQSLPRSERAPSGLLFVLLLLTRKGASEVALAIDSAPEHVTALAPRELPIPPVAEPPSAAAGVGGASDEPETPWASLSQDTIRVEVARLDDALERLGALVVTSFRLQRAALELRQRGVDARALETILSEHRRELAALRGSLTLVRMVSIAQLLERVPLIVRGMARDSGKQVQLCIDAGRAELDKAVAERVFPALVHLIRNAVDHAIEPADERRKRGKSEVGTITLRCHERAGNQLELCISDDGAGVDRARVAARAGVAVPSDDRALLALITRPGLSTMESATARSGRGMGMDIVERVTVGMLGGELKLHTEQHVGTTFTLRLPMSISIVESFAFRCGPQSFVVPLSAVEEVVELASTTVLSTPVVQRGARSAKVLQQRGQSIPLLELGALFSLPAGEGMRSALVVQREGERYAFTVDHMLGQQEVVVRPLEDPLVKVRGVTGSTDLGDGRPTLVLDLWALTRVAGAEARA